VVWVGVAAASASTPVGPAPRGARRGRLRLFFRGEGALFLPPSAEAEAALEGDARAVYDYLRAEGASFTADLRAGLGLAAEALNAALAELVLAGLVTNDSLEALRPILAGAGDGEPERRPLSTLEDELAARLGPRERPLTARRYREAKARVARRLQAQAAPTPASAAPSPGGRWSLVHRAGVLGPPLSDEERAGRQARVLLARYGVLSRDCLEREAGPWDWSALYPVLQRMELRGEVRRGYFVAGLSGAQFALPEAVEALRAPAGGDVFVLSAADPANVFGGEAGGEGAPRFARVPSTHVALEQGRPVVIFEDNGERLTALPDTGPEVLRRAVEAYLSRPHAPRRVIVSRWNGEPVLGSAGQPLLKALGFQATPSAMEWRAPP
jgi:ATP-dependent Lhr-like helicase